RAVEILMRELEKANANLLEVDEIKSDFISIASHQLRTPVSVMKGYLSLLSEGAYGMVTPRMQEKITQMYHMNDRLVHLINNMLNVSRIERRKIEFSCEQTDLLVNIRGVVDEMRYKAEEKGLKLMFKKSDYHSIPVFVDIGKLEEVLVNLLDNAVKYTVSGTIAVSAILNTKDDVAEVHIRDTGLGIPKAEQGKLFRKFYRPDTPASFTTQGTGLGLYICGMFITGMGGKIWIE